MEIKFDNVYYEYNNKLLLDNINLTILDNSISSIVGPSSSGKSIILDLIKGIKQPTKGSITIDDILYNFSNIGYVIQNSKDLFFLNSVKDEFNLTLSQTKVKNKEKRINNALKMVNLNTNILNQNPSDLSYGEQKKLALAMALILNPKILLLDEPTLGLDLKSRQEIIKLIRIMKNRYHKTIVIVSKDVDMIHAISDQIFVLNGGKIQAEGDKYKIFTDQELLDKNKVDMPKLIKFSHLVKELKNINIGYRDDINDLIKDVYRYGK